MSYRNAGFPKKDMKHFNNVINQSLLEYEDPEIPIIHKVPPPALHMMMGAVAKIVTTLKSFWPQFDDWAKENHIFERGYQGGGFDGVNSKKILDKVCILKKQLPLHLLPFASCLESLGKVVQSCFKDHLAEEWQTSVDAFGR